jgi:hypothetical protein
VIVNALYHQSIEPTQGKKLHKRIMTKLRPLLGGLPRINYEYSDDYPLILLNVMTELELAQGSDQSQAGIKKHFVPGPRLDAWSRLSEFEQAYQFLHNWTDGRSWYDLPGADFEPPSPFSSNRMLDPFAFKPTLGHLTILRYLSRLVPGRWYSIADLVDTIWEEETFAMRPPQPYTRKSDLRKTPQLKEAWYTCDGEYYIGMLASSLYEFGIVSLGYEDEESAEAARKYNAPDMLAEQDEDEEDDPFFFEEPNYTVGENPASFQITQFGGALLATFLVDKKKAARQEKESPPARSLIVQPNFELLLLCTDFPALYSVLPFVQVEQIGTSSRLTLTRQAVLRALGEGKSFEQLLQALEEHSQRELPQNVIYTLNDWARHNKEASISQVFLFELSSEAAADEI